MSAGDCTWIAPNANGTDFDDLEGAGAMAEIAQISQRQIRS
jgi:hypothetical protein